MTTQARELIVDAATLSKWSGIGVFLCSAKGQDHVGVVAEVDGLSVLHLTRHHSLKLEPIDALFTKQPYIKALITRPSLPIERAINISIVCRRIYRKQGRSVPFGFGDWRGAFDKEGAYLANQRGRTGLTCSTLVLSVFELAGYLLFDFDTWEPRNADMPWQIAMVKWMHDAGADPDHIAGVDASVDGRRFRPGEVAAGFAALPDMLTQAEAETVGQSLRQKVL